MVLENALGNVLENGEIQLFSGSGENLTIDLSETPLNEISLPDEYGDSYAESYLELTQVVDQRLPIIADSSAMSDLESAANNGNLPDDLIIYDKEDEVLYYTEDSDLNEITTGAAGSEEGLFAPNEFVD